MAEQPAKDVFADEEGDELEEQFVVDKAEEAEQKAGTETAAAEAGADDIEIVLAEEEKKDEGEAEEAEEAEEVEEEKAAPEEGDGVEQEAEAEEAVDDDLKSYSKKVQDRIARERRLVRKAREEAENAVSQERTLRIEAERKSLSAHKNLTEVLLVNIDGQIKVKTAEILAAKEAGESAKEVEIQGELDDLRAKKREIDGARVDLERQTEDFERKAKEVPVKEQVSDAAQTWVRQNRWFGRKGFAAETLFVHNLDNQLATERGDKGSAEYFRELNLRIRREIPDLADKVKRAFKPQSPPRSAVAPVSRSSASVKTDAQGKRRVTLDSTDIKNMREFKLDPTNKAHVAAYAREKLQASKGD